MTQATDVSATATSRDDDDDVILRRRRPPRPRLDVNWTLTSSGDVTPPRCDSDRRVALAAACSSELSDDARRPGVPPPPGVTPTGVPLPGGDFGDLCRPSSITNSLQATHRFTSTTASLPLYCIHFLCLKSCFILWKIKYQL